MLIYIVIYALLLSSIYFERKIKHSDKKIILLFWVFVFTLFRGLRWNTGTDWEQYYQVFGFSEWNNIFSFDRGGWTMEPGYIFLNTLIKTLGGNYTAFLLFTNLLILLVYTKFALTNSKTPIYVFVLIMFSTQFFPVRIGIAVAFVMIGFSNFLAKKYLLTIIYTFFAISIHSSAIILIPAYAFIYVKKIPAALAVVISIVFFALVQIGSTNDMLLNIASIINLMADDSNTEIARKFEHYLDYGENSIMAVSLILNSVIFIVTLLFFGKIADEQKDEKAKKKFAYIYNAYFIFVIIGVIFSLPQMTNLKRMQNYFMFAFPLLFSSLIIWGQKKMPRYGFVFTQMFVFYSLFRSYTLFFGGYPELHFPYKSIFDY